MKYTMIIVPPGGGEADYQLQMEGDHIPQTGEYILVHEEEGSRCAAFQVRYVINQFEEQQLQDMEGYRRHLETIVEVEFVEHPYQSDAHKRSIDMYSARGKKAKSFPESGY